MRFLSLSRKQVVRNQRGDCLAEAKACDRAVSGTRGEGTYKLQVLHSGHQPGFDSKGTGLRLSYSSKKALSPPEDNSEQNPRDNRFLIQRSFLSA